MKLKITFGILLIFALLSCSTVSASMMPSFEPGKAYTITQEWQGELIGKGYSDDYSYVELYNEETGMTYYNLYVTKDESTGAILGKDYEWKRMIYPDGRESVSFHRI
jgi:hypothetical protein